jgi:GT2 family glycosyltransferase
MQQGQHSPASSVDVSIIIVNWNSTDYLRKCLASILAETRKLTYEVIVIDAASFDGCNEMLRQHYPQVRFLQSDTNPGFAGANNLAAKESKGKCLLFLNPDTELIEGALDELYAQWGSLPRAGVLGCKLLNSDRTTQTSCLQSFPTIANQFLDSECLRRWFPKSSLWGTWPLFAPGSSPWKIDVVAGACMLIGRSAFEAVGGFTEEYFMYSEDVDLCYKLARAGFENYYIPSGCVLHHGGSSSAKSGISSFSSVMMRESRARYFARTQGRLYALAYRFSMGFAALCRFVLLVPGVVLGMRGAAGASSSSSFGKWWAILKWSMGLQPWLKNYR